jgi:uncharacterized repeat protein (TIGR02543 family)
VGIATLPKPTLEGFIFNNWFDNAALEGNAITSIGATEHGHKTLYAKWDNEFDEPEDDLLLDFDTYVVTKWNTIFMLNIRRLNDSGYAVTQQTICHWYKDDNETPIHTGLNYTAYEMFKNGLEPGSYRFELLIDGKSVFSTIKEINTFAQQTAMVVYPNPVASGEAVTVEGLPENSRVQVFDRQGRVVLNTVVSGGLIPLKGLPPGVYVISSDIGNSKIIIER